MRLRLTQVFASIMLLFSLNDWFLGVARAGTVLKGEHQSAEVSVDYPHQRITIRLLESFPEGKYPSALELIYRDEKGKRVAFEVSALASLSKDPPVYQGALPSYFSVLSPGQQSHVGFQIRIPLSRGKSELLR